MVKWLCGQGGQLPHPSVQQVWVVPSTIPPLWLSTYLSLFESLSPTPRLGGVM